MFNAFVIDFVYCCVLLPLFGTRLYFMFVYSQGIFEGISSFLTTKNHIYTAGDTAKTNHILGGKLYK